MKVLALVIFLAGCGRWEPRARTAATVLATGLLVVDAGQTRWMTYHYDHLTEANPVLGEQPSRSVVNAYFATWVTTTIAGRIWLPRWACWALNVGLISAETWTVTHNYQFDEGLR